MCHNACSAQKLGRRKPRAADVVRGEQQVWRPVRFEERLPCATGRIYAVLVRIEELGLGVKSTRNGDFSQSVTTQLIAGGQYGDQTGPGCCGYQLAVGRVRRRDDDMFPRAFTAGDFQQILMFVTLGNNDQLLVAISLNRQGANGSGELFRSEWTGYREHDPKVRKAPQP